VQGIKEEEKPKERPEGPQMVWSVRPSHDRTKFPEMAEKLK